MKVEIWSDVMCPFCYIGKRKLENALAAFDGKNKVEVSWRSYQLNPGMQYQEGLDIYTYLAEMKGRSREWAEQMHESVTQMAKEVGLDYHFEKVKIANSFDAHRVIQLAKKYNLTNEVEERFFKAYFTEGAIMSDHATLLQLAVEAGLKQEEVQAVLDSDEYALEVKADIAEAQQIGVRGVPFFVFNRKYAVSGAQDTQVFLETLKRTLETWKILKGIE